MLLLHKQLINRDLVQKILSWRHTGFNVQSKVRAESKGETEQVGKYMIRPILSLRRLSFDKTEGQVVYQYGKHSTESEHMHYLEFIARVTSPIPDKGQVMVHYYGLYSNVHRGKMRKIYEVDPLTCPQCGGRMPACALHADRKIISFIEDHRVIDKIINHLKLTFNPERPPHPAQPQLNMAAEERVEYI